MDNTERTAFTSLLEQLKRKDEEIEYLNVQLESCFIGEKELFEQLDQAKAELELYKHSKQVSYEEMQRRWNEVEWENRKLKRQHEGDKGLITAAGKQNYQLLQEYDKLKTERDSYIDKYFLESQKVVNLSKVLREIKEIAEKMKNMEEECGNCMSYTTIQCKQILQKISEVEDEN